MLSRRSSAHLVFIALVGAAAATSGCRNRDAGHVAAPAPPGPPGTDLARYEIADARCRRMARCNDIGPGQAFERHDDCVRAARSELSQRLTASGCAGGVPGERLEACVRAIEQVDCTTPSNRWQSPETCAPQRLCAQAM